MTEDELKSGLELLQSEYIQKKNDLFKRYAIANNPYNVGDIITDHYHTIKIDKIGFSISDNTCQCVYIGTELNKNLTVSKRQVNKSIYQNNVERKH